MHEDGIRYLCKDQKQYGRAKFHKAVLCWQSDYRKSSHTEELFLYVALNSIYVPCMQYVTDALRHEVSLPSIGNVNSQLSAYELIRMELQNKFNIFVYWCWPLKTIVNDCINYIYIYIYICMYVCIYIYI